MTNAQRAERARRGAIDRDRRPVRPPSHARDPPSRSGRSVAPVRGFGFRVACVPDPGGPGHAVHRGARRRAPGARRGAREAPGRWRGSRDWWVWRTIRRRWCPGTRRWSARRAGCGGSGSGDSGDVLEALVPAILEQKVIGEEARRAWVGLVRRYGEDAPGPPGLRLPPTPETLAGLPYYAYHPFGVEQRRADLIRARIAVRGAPGSPGRRGIGTRWRSGARLRACCAVPGDRPVDRGRGGDPRVRRCRRRQPRRLPPAVDGGVGAGRRAAGHRRTDAGAARALPRPARPRAPAARAVRRRAAAARAAPLAPARSSAIVNARPADAERPRPVGRSRGRLGVVAEGEERAVAERARHLEPPGQAARAHRPGAAAIVHDDEVDLAVRAPREDARVTLGHRLEPDHQLAVGHDLGNRADRCDVDPHPAAGDDRAGGGASGRRPATAAAAGPAAAWRGRWRRSLLAIMTVGPRWLAARRTGRGGVSVLGPSSTSVFRWP